MRIILYCIVIQLRKDCSNYKIQAIIKKKKAGSGESGIWSRESEEYEVEIRVFAGILGIDLCNF